MHVRVAMIAVLAVLGLVSAAEAAEAAEPRSGPMTEQQVEVLLAEPNYARGGYYFAFEGLASLENNGLIGGRPSADNTTWINGDPQISGGFDLRIGYRPNRWTASELSGLYIYNWATINGVGQLAWGMWASQRLILSKSRFQPYGVVGLGFAQLISRSGGSFSPRFTPVFGLGMECYTNQSIAITLVANYYLPVTSNGTVDFVTAGIGMIFY